MGRTAEMDGNEINLAQMWSLFCLWGFETSLQSFKFPCNLEIKEISKCICLPPSGGCPRPPHPFTMAPWNRTADVKLVCGGRCPNWVCNIHVPSEKLPRDSVFFVTGRLSDQRLRVGQEGLLTGLGLFCCFSASGWPVSDLSKQHHDDNTEKVIRHIALKPRLTCLRFHIRMAHVNVCLTRIIKCVCSKASSPC